MAIFLIIKINNITFFTFFEETSECALKFAHYTLGKCKYSRKIVETSHRADSTKGVMSGTACLSHAFTAEAVQGPDLCSAP